MPLAQNSQTTNFVVSLLVGAIAVVLIIAVIGAAILLSKQSNNIINNPPATNTPQSSQPQASSDVPKFNTEEILSGLSNPWDIVFLKDNSFIFTERANKISYFKNGVVNSLNVPSDTYVRGEGGMLGLAIDPQFDSNNYIYMCFNATNSNNIDVRVVRWQFNPNTFSIYDRKDIITGMPSLTSGRHSGCQLEFGPDGYLWVGTGDAATTENPQNPGNLGGKILRIDREGKAAPGNLSAPFDTRIYSYGHRNTQGLGFFSEDSGFEVAGISIEQGSSRDDEVNKLVPGNFGWAPGPGYNESVPMTDSTKFPGAIKAIWASGNPTVATSGGTIIQGAQWQAWQNAVAIAVQKDTKVIILELNKDLTIRRETVILDNIYGRIRTVQQDIDGNLYVLTDNGSGRDKIIKLSVAAD